MDIREEIKFKICSIINGNPQDCDKKNCRNCTFRLPRLEICFNDIHKSYQEAGYMPVEEVELPKNTHLQRGMIKSFQYGAYEKAQQDILQRTGGKLWRIKE